MMTKKMPWLPFCLLSAESQQQQQKIFNVCFAGDYCVISNGHKVVCGMICRICEKVMTLQLCDSDEYGFKTCNSCVKEKACN